MPILVRCLNWVYSRQTMIHDTLDQLVFYAPAIPHLEQIASLDDTGVSIEGMKSFSPSVLLPLLMVLLWCIHQRFVWYSHCKEVSCLLLHTEGKTRKGPWMKRVLFLSRTVKPTDVVRSEEGTFTVFMPGNPLLMVSREKRVRPQ